MLTWASPVPDPFFPPLMAYAANQSFLRPTVVVSGLFVLSLHLSLAWALWQIDGVRQSVAQAMPMFVEYITPPKVIKPEEPLKPPPPPPPKVVTPKRPPPIMVSKRVEHDPPPAFQVAPQAPPEPLPPVEAPPAPPAPPVAAAPPAPPAPPPIIPPNFNAAYLNNPAPAYPAMARRMGETGKVLLRVYVAPDGHAEKIELNRSSGSQTLDRAALEAVASWRFVPAKQGDHPVPAWVLVPIAFQLEG